MCPHHIQGSVTKYLLKGEYIPSVYEVASGKGMAAQMGMKPTYTRLARNSLEHRAHAVLGDRFAVRSEKEARMVGLSGSGRKRSRYRSKAFSAEPPKGTIRSLLPFPITFTYLPSMFMSSNVKFLSSLHRSPVSRKSMSIA